MPRRIVIHAGFHKTGTSTVQAVLRDNAAALAPHLRGLLKEDMRPLLHAARGFSTWRDPISLVKFRLRFEAVLARQTDLTGRVLCLSAEELSGHLPGRGPLADYSAAPELAREMVQAAQGLWPGAELALFYSTRAPDSWLTSAYSEHVKSSSLTLDWDAFAETYAGAAELDRIVDRVAESVDCPVHRHRLEDSTRLPAGPATPLLALCGLDPALIARLAVPSPANRRPDPAVLLDLLSANRAYPDRAARKAAKRAILTAAQENTGD